MYIIKDNVELIIEPDKLEKYTKLGFKEVSVPIDAKEQVKKLKDMKVEELKAIAKEKGIESDSLTKNELLALLGE